MQLREQLVCGHWAIPDPDPASGVTWCEIDQFVRPLSAVVRWLVKTHRYGVVV